MESTSSTGYGGVAKYDNEAIPEGFRSQIRKELYSCSFILVVSNLFKLREACAELGNITKTTWITINLLKDRAGLPHLNPIVGFSDPANNHGVNDLIRRFVERRCV